MESDASLLPGRTYDIVIANINRNILLQDMSTYVETLNENGNLFLSGFYEEDIPIIEAECAKHNLRLTDVLKRNDWVALKFKK